MNHFSSFDRLIAPLTGEFTCAYYTRTSDATRWAIQCHDGKPHKAAGPLQPQQCDQQAPDHFRAGMVTIDATGWDLGAFTQTGGYWKRSSIVLPAAAARHPRR